ncbi:unnamed protein product [Mucor hiemalis]
MSTPLRRELMKEERTSLDSLYNDLDVYIKELDGENDMVEENLFDDKMTREKQPSFSFQVVSAEPPFEEENSSNNSSMTSATTILSRQGSSTSAAETEETI